MRSGLVWMKYAPLVASGTFVAGGAYIILSKQLEGHQSQATNELLITGAAMIVVTVYLELTSGALALCGHAKAKINLRKLHLITDTNPTVAEQEAAQLWHHGFYKEGYDIRRNAGLSLDPKDRPKELVPPCLAGEN